MISSPFKEEALSNKEYIEVELPTAEDLTKKKKIGKRFLIWFISVAVFSAVLAIVWNVEPNFRQFAENLNKTFYYFLVAGFLFSMVDGAIGMSYGVTSTTFALSMGIPPASASSAVHLSEILSNAIAGVMHYKMGNVNMKLFWLLVIPGAIGAVTGAFLLSSLEHYSMYTKPVVSLYTLILGIVILSKAFKLKAKISSTDKKLKNVRALGLFGGFVDAVGGGGWGSIVLSTLIAGNRNPRTSLGSVKLSRFFIAMLSSLTFITMLNTIHWDAISGLIIGSAIASPIAAKVSNRISAKSIMVLVGIIVILVSINSITKFVLRIV